MSNVLTDQHLQDSRVTCPPPDLADLPKKRHVLSAAELNRLSDYKRYAWTDDGVSPLALPGKSAHLVYADSDEHDETGHITESGETAELMANKRAAKVESISRAGLAGRVGRRSDDSTADCHLGFDSTRRSARPWA